MQQKKEFIGGGLKLKSRINIKKTIRKMEKGKGGRVKPVMNTSSSEPEYISGQREMPPIAQVMMTDAENRFREIKMQRQKERIERKMDKSHRNRVDDFNQKLEKLPNHFDIPKVGPG